MSNPSAAGCSEIVSNDVAMVRDSISIDADIRHQEWSPLLRILPISPTDRSCQHGARRVTSMQRGIWTRNNQTMMSRSIGLGVAVFNTSMRSFVSKDACHRRDGRPMAMVSMVSWVVVEKGRSRSSDENT
jgi:hypothetical protein